MKTGRMFAAQVSLETMVFIGMALLFLIPLTAGMFIISKNQVEDAAIQQARVMGRLLAEKMYEVDSLPGNGESTIVLLLPQGIKQVEFSYLEEPVDQRARTTKVTMVLQDGAIQKSISTTSFCRQPDGIESYSITGLEPGRAVFKIKKSGLGVEVTKS